MIKLISCDNEQFLVEDKVAEKSGLIRDVLEVGGDRDEAIPLSTIEGRVLRKVLDWCDFHSLDHATDEKTSDTGKEDKPSDRLTSDEKEQPSGNAERSSRCEEIEEWDREFISVDELMLFEIVIAANFLDIKPLMLLGLRFIAQKLEGMSVYQIRKMFNIINPFTAEEETRVMAENRWADSV